MKDKGGGIQYTWRQGNWRQSIPGLGCAEDVGSTVLLSVGAVDFKIKVGREESVQYHLHLSV